MFNCNLCDKCYTDKKGLYKHERQKHEVFRETVPSAEFQCFHCNLIFDKKTKLMSHVNMHKSNRKNRRGRSSRILCPIDSCEEKFVTNPSLRKHLTGAHNVSIKEEFHEFETECAFKQWKIETENSLSANYVLDTTPKNLKGDNKLRSYYICHRSHFPKLKDKSKRTLKGAGTNKISRACPSVMIVTKSAERIAVTFYPIHMGHSCEVGRLRINKDERNRLAGKLAEGVTIERVLQDIRTAPVENSDGLKRIQLLEKKDLHNILRDFSIGYSTKRHENDALSVQIWVEQMKLQDMNPVLYYKEQGHSEGVFENLDFVLIIMTEFQEQQLKKFGEKVCIDGTHGLNSYKFQLYTLMVVNEYGCGVPVAFCFSNKCDTALFKVYFECIKSRVGLVTSSVFMSDDAPAFYNAWQAVMTSVKYLLLCCWHINRNWIQNLTKIQSTDKRKLVSKSLQVLLKETDLEKFKLYINTFLVDLENDPDTCDFGEYFRRNYFNRVEKWAFCFRLHVGLNTNMFLESLHKTIKHCYLEGKQCKRLDKSINCLLNLVRDKMFERVIIISKQKCSKKILKIKASHMKSTKISANMILKVDTIKWLVTSTRDDNHKYLVERVSSSCVSDCELRCVHCRNICVHAFKCACIDNMIYLNICKHIHACVGSSLEDISDEYHHSQNSITEGVKNFNETFNMSCSQQKSETKQIIQSKLDLLLGLNERAQYTDTMFSKVNRLLDKTIGELNEVQFMPHETVNVRKNVEPQIRFLPKSANKNQNQHQNSSFVENAIIKEALSFPGREVLNIHTGFDHTY